VTNEAGDRTRAELPEAEATRYELERGVVTITLDRPDSRNALSTALMNSLGDQLARAAGDPACRVVVLTNAGPVFCAGADLKSGGIRADDVLRWPLPALLEAMLDYPKPLIGKIAGHCMGGGVGLAAACDISLVASDALFGFTEVRLGVVPAIISVVCLPKMRAGDAMQLFLTGERISAERAATLGIVSSVAPAGELDAAVAELCATVLKGAPNALRTAKELIRRVPSMDRAAAFEWTGALAAEVFASAEGREGMAAFRERRPPTWALQD
jgi:methylglutaconyl-CoA hydratase